MNAGNQWDLYHDESVYDIVVGVARRVAAERNVDREDMEQEAWLLVTDRGKDLVSMAWNQQWGLLRTALYRDLLNLTARQERIKSMTQSLDLRHEEDIEGEETAAPVTLCQRKDVSQYDRELVQSLLPAVWDWQFCYGMQVENAPDADMPRTTPNKATGNTLAAHLADIRTAWVKAPLTLAERQALFLIYSLDWTTVVAAQVLGVSHQAVSASALRGVGKIVGWLNGDEALIESLEEAA